MSDIILYERDYQCNQMIKYKDFCPVNSGEIVKKMGKNPEGKFYTDNTQYIENDEVKKFYADKTKELNITQCKIKVVKDGNKISIRWSHTVRRRRVGKQYFSVLKTHRFVTYNYKSKNFYHGTIESKRKKIKSISEKN